MVTLHLRARGVALDVESEARVLCLFGPSGSGKTTCLETIAGLLRPPGACVVFGGRDLSALPPRARDIGYLPQDAPLFPHLTVRENLRYGAPDADVGNVARALGVEALLDRAPRLLSGGERRRVALGRATARRPRVLLLDEPFAGLDAPLRARLLEYVARLDTPHVVLVTHDPKDALGLADEVVRLEGGGCVERGPPADVFGPHSPLVEPVALVDVRVRAAAGGYAEVEAQGRALSAHLPEARAGERVRLALRADDVTLSLARHDGLSARNQVDARVVALEPRREQVLARLDAGFALYALLDPRSVSALALSAGSRVVAQFKASALRRAGV